MTLHDASGGATLIQLASCARFDPTLFGKPLTGVPYLAPQGSLKPSRGDSPARFGGQVTGQRQTSIQSLSFLQSNRLMPVLTLRQGALRSRQLPLGVPSPPDLLPDLSCPPLHSCLTQRKQRFERVTHHGDTNLAQLQTSGDYEGKKAPPLAATVDMMSVLVGLAPDRLPP